VPDGAPDLPPDAPPPAYDFCAQIPRLASAPVIDGVLDPYVALRDVTPVRWDGVTAIPAGQRMAYAAAWRNDGLYLFVRVWDADRTPSPDLMQLWCGDGLEIYVDDDGTNNPADSYDQMGTRQFIVAAPADDTNRRNTALVFMKTASQGSWTSTEFGAWPTPDGYVVEALIRASDIGKAGNWNLSGGETIGLDLAHDISASPPGMGACGARLGQYFIRVRQPESGDFTDLPYWNPAAFCKPTLLP
jgi:hypothetical protein